MTQMTVGEFKSKFSDVLELVKKGGEVEVLYGRSKEPVAKLIPLSTRRNSGLLGALEGEATYTMSDNWKMTPEELLEI